MYIYIYIYVYMYIYIYVYVYINICMYVYNTCFLDYQREANIVYICKQTNICISCICIHTELYMYVDVHST